MVLVYATRSDLISYAPAGTVVPDDPEATRLLTSASQVIYRATKTAIYDTDDTGMPTDTGIRTAFQRATCAQALWWVLTGDEQGLVSLYEQVSIGSLSLSRVGRGANGGSGVTGQQLAPQAATELIDGRVLAGSLVQSYTWEGSWV